MPRLVRKRPAEPIDEASPSASPEPETQRRRLSQEAEDGGEGEERGEREEDSVTVEDDEDNGGAHASLDQMAKKLVRYAMACEYQRKPIRRADIGEKVLAGGGGRKFKEVFSRAQADLKHVFGMEMVELPAREKFTVAQKRAAATAKTSRAGNSAASANTSTSTGTTSWILTSILPSHFRDPAIIAPPAAPTADEDATYTALYTMLVSLISLSGNALPDAKLERFMRRLQLTDTAPLDGGRERSDKVLKRMEREGYIVRIKENVGGGEGDVYWTVGPRGKVEVGADGVRGMVQTVYAPATEAEEAELEKKVAKNLGLGEKTQRGLEQSTQQEPSEEEGRSRGGRTKKKNAANRAEDGSDED